MQKLISETFNNSYKEEQFRSFIDALLYGADFKKAQPISPLPSDFTDFIRSAKRICKYEYDENGISKTIDVLAIKLKRHSSVERARAAQRNFVARYLNGSRDAQKDAALVAFLYEDEKGSISPDWRFSFVQMTYKTEFVQTETGIKINSKTELTPAKRFSFLVGENEHTHTAQQQLKSCLEKAKNKTKITIEDLSAAFDIEKVSDEFFEKYKELFQTLADKIKRLYEADKNIKKDFNAHNINIEDFAKKTLGQLVFLYFIQKKGWLGVKQGQQWGSGDKKFLRNAFDKKYRGYENFFNDILEHLFYEALAKDRTANNDCFALLNCRIPFLNGGLFEPVNGYEWQNTNLAIDNAIFKEIFDVFDLYNFTVKEDEPLEKEVAIDPEMLGKVFENLLPENIRKGNGAYYTPRPVVYYMCQESLISCLDNKVNSHKEIIPRQDIESLIRTGTSVYKNKTRDIAVELPQSIKDNAKELDRVLAEIKICDPAIGSGAFPVGIMNEVVRARAALSEYIGQPERTTYELKRNAVENCIYGVDLDGGAVEIAKLRLWLSLVVDEENISEIKPLPNLDYKIMQGNSLISSYEGIDFDDIAAREQKNQFSLFAGDSKNIIQQLTEKQRHLLNSPGDKGKAIKQEIEDLIVRLVKEYYQEKAQLECRLINFYEDKIRDFAQNREKRNFFPWKLFFADVFANGGFDIVIANPPYIKEYDNRTAFDGFRDLSPYYDGKMDLWYAFACYGLDMLREKGILCFIAQNNWITSAGAEKLRNKVIADSKIKQLIDFNDYMVFKKSGVSIQTMIMIFEKNNLDDGYTFDYRQLHSIEDEDMFAMLEHKENKNIKYLAPIITRKKYKNKYLTFSDSEELLNKIAKSKVYIEEAEIAQGIVFPQDFLNKQNAKKLGEGFSVGDSIFALTNEKLIELSLSAHEKTLIKPYYTSKEIHCYSIEQNNSNWVIYTDSSFKKNDSMNSYPNLKKHLDKFLSIFTSDNKPYGLHRARQEHFFRGEKIISLRKCVEKPSFSWCNFDTYVSQTYFIIQTKRWNMKFLTGILNSKLVAFWLKNKGKMQGSNYQIDKEPLLEIPLPKNPSNAQQAPIIARVDKILDAKKENPQADTSDMEKQIDQLVYALYGLTEEEIRIVEQG